MDEASTLFESYRVAQNMEYFQWLERRLMQMQEAANHALIGAKNWDEARLHQGRIQAFQEALAALVPDEARI